MIRPDDLAARLGGLDSIGVGPDGVTRLAWTPEDAACRAWFREQAAALGRTVEVDPAGNLWAPPADAPPPWWGTGSHLDSVRAGGRFDGPLGVVAAFEVAARASVPVAVIAFADEEGARYNTPTFGSRALAGRLEIDDVLARRDDDGIALGDAMAAAGVDPGGLAGAPGWLPRLRGFLELHIDQTRDLAQTARPAGAVASLAARSRLQAELRGRADHAGTTPAGERRDALSAAARLIVAAEEVAEAAWGLRVTAGRLLAEPNALSTVPARVRVWFDARAPEAREIDAWLEGLEGRAAAIADLTGVDVRLTVQSRSPAVEFDATVRAALGRALGDGGAELVCFAGHDAGVLATQVPAGMVFVRNATGVSHAPDEQVSLDDAAVAAGALLAALEELARR